MNSSGPPLMAVCCLPRTPRAQSVPHSGNLFSDCVRRVPAKMKGIVDELHYTVDLLEGGTALGDVIDNHIYEQTLVSLSTIKWHLFLCVYFEVLPSSVRRKSFLWIDFLGLLFMFWSCCQCWHCFFTSNWTRLCPWLVCLMSKQILLSKARVERDTWACA